MPASELLEVVVVANCLNTMMLPLPLTLLVPFAVVLLVPLEAADEPTSSELVGRTVEVLGRRRQCAEVDLGVRADRVEDQGIHTGREVDSSARRSGRTN